jgi:hypothetical protein
MTADCGAQADAVLGQACGQKRPVALPPLRTAGGIGLSVAVHGALSKGRPAAVEFCSGFLNQPIDAKTAFTGSDFRGLEPQGETFDCSGQACGCGPHVAVVVGRKTVKDANGKPQCMLVLRNSWGADCGGYHESRRAFCDRERGDIFVPEGELLRNTSEASYFDG